MKKNKNLDAFDFLAYGVARLLAAFLRALPMPWALALGACGGRIVYWMSTKRRKVAMKNLRNAFGDSFSMRELANIVRRVYENLGYSAVEVLCLPKMSLEYLNAHVTVEGREQLEALKSAGQPAVLVTAHFGNWEMAGVFSASQGYPLIVLARTQKFTRVYNYLNTIRESRGCQVIAKGMATREMVRALDEKKFLAMLSDQDGGLNGLWVDLLGTVASVPRGAFALAAKKQTALIPVFVIRKRPEQYHIVLAPAVEPGSGEISSREEKLCRGFNQALETHIRRYPHLWLWAHKRWKSSPVRRILILNDGKLGHLRQSEYLAGLASKILVKKFMDKGHPVPRISVSARSVEIRYRSPAARIGLVLWALLPVFRKMSATWILDACLAPDCLRELARNAPDIAISCGSSTAALNLALKEIYGSQALAIQKPGVFPLKRFDLAVVPAHDLRKKEASERVVSVSGALNPMNPQRLAEAGKHWRKELGLLEQETVLGVLLGGPSKHWRWAPGELKQAVASLLDWAGENKTRVFLTTSRRTEPELDQELQALLRDDPRCAAAVFPNQENPPETVPGILALSKAVVVTGESVSMVSEAVSALKPVLALTPSAWAPGQGNKEKVAQFLNGLEAAKKIRLSGVSQLKQKMGHLWENQEAPRGLEEEGKLEKALERYL